MRRFIRAMAWAVCRGLFGWDSGQVERGNGWDNRAGSLVALGVCLLAGVARAAPAITGIAPAQGAPGTQVLIGGANFADVTQVKFNNSPADFTILANDRILAVTPVGSVSGPI